MNTAQIGRLVPATSLHLTPHRLTKRKAFKKFQRLDLARAALHDGLICAWDTGLGKTWAMFMWPLLKCGFDKDKGFVPLEPVLIVAPEHLHQQIAEEAAEQFKIKITKLDCQDTYLHLTCGGGLTPGWYITSFTQLASNKSEPVPLLEDYQGEEELVKLCKELSIDVRKALAADLTEPVPGDPDKRRQCSPSTKLRAALKGPLTELQGAVGTEFNGIMCVWKPSLAELCRNAFGCVVIDEATKIKGEATLVGKGCRLMNPKYRLVLTATPIKNRLPDLFWLAWWAVGGKPEAHPRWPYSNEEGEQSKFAEEFLVCERNLSEERRKNHGRESSQYSRGRYRRGKPTAEVCNIHRLWKLIGPVILRRRKQEIGEDIVMKLRQPIRVPMGKHQAETYEYHLKADYTDKNGQPATGAKLQSLRSAAAAPHSDLLKFVDGMERTDSAPPSPENPYRSRFAYTPKIAACLTVCEQIIRRGEQTVVFSAFHEPLDTMARYLDQAGIPHFLLDGRKTQAARGKLAADFKKGRPIAPPVLLAGINAMAEGHSWHLANNCILLAFDWAYNLFEQGINRVHRINSPKPVNVYPIICQGTIDRKLEALIEEKGNACELVLDGKLLGENSTEVNLAELLQIAEAEFSKEQTYPEEKLLEEWPALRDRLRHAWESTRYAGLVNGGIKVSRPAEPLQLPDNFVVKSRLIVLGQNRLSSPSPEASRLLAAPAKRALGLPVRSFAPSVPSFF